MQIVYQTGIVRELVGERQQSLNSAAAAMKRVDLERMKESTPEMPGWWVDTDADDVGMVEQSEETPELSPAPMSGVDAALFGSTGPSGAGFTVSRVVVVDNDGVTETLEG